MAEKKLKIFFQTMDAIGHVNSCVGLAQALQERGHQITFLTDRSAYHSIEQYNFNFIIYENKEKKDDKQVAEDRKIHPLKGKEESKGFRDSPIFGKKKSIEKLRPFDKDNIEKVHFYDMYQEMKHLNPLIEKTLKEEKPDLIIVDHFQVVPCIPYGNYIWGYLSSCNPGFIYNSMDIPPVMSGYPSNDRTGWNEFRQAFNASFRAIIQFFQNKLNEDFGYPRIPEDQFLFKSPYLNVYAFPEELDYTDLVEKPQNFVRFDTFCRDEVENFELPDEFKEKVNKDDKLIYVSMGSIGSTDSDLLKNLIDALASTPYKYIISKGPNGDSIDLPENMWGKPFLPQTKILPIVDYVITHGGNNTICETMKFGKPMLVMPIFTDQYDNAQRIEEKGFGLRLDAYDWEKPTLISKLDQLIKDQDIKERCLKASERIKTGDTKIKACIQIEKIVETAQKEKEMKVDN